MSVYRRPSRRLTQLAQLLTLASTASAVSLQDFQAISIRQVPSLPCLSAYGSTILGCSRSDFQDGVQCSESCAQGILQSQANIITTCRDVEVNNKSLLGLTLLGGLLDALCPNFQATSVTSTGAPTTMQTFVTPTLTPTTRTAESSTIVQSETDVPVVSVAPTDTVDTTDGVALPSSTQSPTKTSTNHGGSPFGGFSGGGSPIDTIVPGSSSRRTLPVCVNMAAALAVSLIAEFLML